MCFWYDWTSFASSKVKAEKEPKHVAAKQLPRGFPGLIPCPGCAVVLLVTLALGSWCSRCRGEAWWGHGHRASRVKCTGKAARLRGSAERELSLLPLDVSMAAGRKESSCCCEGARHVCCWAALGSKQSHIFFPWLAVKSKLSNDVLHRSHQVAPSTAKMHKRPIAHFVAVEKVKICLSSLAGVSYLITSTQKGVRKELLWASL